VYQKEMVLAEELELIGAEVDTVPEGKGGKEEMPAESEEQRKAAGMALAAKRGEVDPKTLQGAAKQMYDSMSEDQLRDFAKKPKGRRIT
jgi:hypothetical protein